MTEDTPITIHQVENGFIVHDYISPNECRASNSDHVFQSMEELIKFMHNHFTHRESHILEDKL